METTVVSLIPWHLEEVKPGLIPDTYYVPPALEGKPSVIHIKDAVSHLYVRDGKTYPVTHSAEEVAESICNDYCRAQLQYTDDTKPALFWVPGRISKDEIATKFAKELADAKKKQTAWFMRLVRIADDDWERFHQHRMITDLQRYAARNLNLLNKPWMQSDIGIEYTKCPACSTQIDTTAALCSNCGFIVNKERAKELGITSSKVSVG